MDANDKAAAERRPRGGKLRLRRRALVDATALQSELHRLLRGRLQRALAQLQRQGPQARRIHLARKRIKELRALLRLFRAGLGAIGKAMEGAVRDVARSLSARRDRQARRDALSRLAECKPISAAEAEALQQVGRALEAQAEACEAGPSDEDGDGAGATERALQEAAAVLQQQLTAVTALELQRGGFAAARRGLLRAYRRARLIALFDWQSLDAEAFHTLRKRIKEHIVHLRVLQKLDPGAEHRIRALEAIAEQLGAEHDDEVLLQGLAALEPAGAAGSVGPAVATVEALVARHRAELRQRAITDTATLFSEPPEQFLRRWRKRWRAAQKRAGRG